MEKLSTTLVILIAWCVTIEGRAYAPVNRDAADTKMLLQEQQLIVDEQLILDEREENLKTEEARIREEQKELEEAEEEFYKKVNAHNEETGDAEREVLSRGKRILPVLAAVPAVGCRLPFSC